MDLLDTKYHYIPETDSVVVERMQDCEAIIEANKEMETYAPRNWSKDLHLVAQIPLVIIEKYKNEKGIDLLRDREALRKFLNDPDNKFMRTKAGRI